MKRFSEVKIGDSVVVLDKELTNVCESLIEEVVDGSFNVNTLKLSCGFDVVANPNAWSAENEIHGDLVFTEPKACASYLSYMISDIYKQQKKLQDKLNVIYKLSERLYE